MIATNIAIFVYTRTIQPDHDPSALVFQSCTVLANDENEAYEVGRQALATVALPEYRATIWDCVHAVAMLNDQVYARMSEN